VKPSTKAFQLLLDQYGDPGPIEGITDNQKWAIAHQLRSILGIVEHGTVSAEWPEHWGWAPIDILLARMEDERQHGNHALSRTDIGGMLADCTADQIDQVLAEAIAGQTISQDADSKYQLNLAGLE
jgi:hypothetical protein